MVGMISYLVTVGKQLSNSFSHGVKRRKTDKKERNLAIVDDFKTFELVCSHLVLNNTPAIILTVYRPGSL